MWQRRLSLLPILAGSALFVVAGVLRWTGESIRVDAACWQWGGCSQYSGGELGVPHVIAPVALGLLAVGYAALALTGPPPFGAPTLRKGLATLAVGLLLYLTATNVPIPRGTNPAQSFEVVIGYGAGLLLSLLGFALTGVSLGRVPAPFRLVPLALPLGLLALVAPWLPVVGAIGLVAYRRRPR